MIHKLEPTNYHRTRDLFGPLRDCHLCIDATIDGVNTGHVFVDDPDSPRSVLMLAKEGTYLAGDPANDAFNTALKERFIRWMIEDRVLWAVYVDVHLSGWADVLPEILPQEIRQLPRYHYLCNALAVDWRANVPDGFVVRRVDRALLDTPGLDIPEHINHWMTYNWESIPGFLENAFGFCTVYQNQHENRVVSWSLCDCISGTACEIGIQTLPDYRRRGLATLTAAAAVDHALSNGFTQVGWQCDRHNFGSMGTSEKVGFRRAHDYVFHVCRIEEPKTKPDEDTNGD
ncbi:MAG: GNAT family N-acetyltransferase [Anaerolineae bacterium]|nr:GNAT family N-acetyltransferase [Anaerolineae bacterium]